MPVKIGPNNYIEYTTYILKSNLDRFNACADKIEILVQNAELVPPELILEYFGYCHFKEDEELRNLEEIVTLTIKETIEYFSKDKAYHFIGITEQKYGLTFKFDECVRTIVTGYRLNIQNAFCRPGKKLKDFETQKRLLNYFFNSLGEFSKPFNKRGKPLFTNYQKVIMAAYIVQKLGFKFTSKRFTKKQLFDAAKKSISKNK